MSIEETLAAEAAHAEANRDATPGPGVRAQRRSGAGNPAVLSVRLTKEQYDQLSERAAASWRSHLGTRTRGHPRLPW